MCLRPHGHAVILVCLFYVCFLRPLRAVVQLWLTWAKTSLRKNWNYFDQDQKSSRSFTEYCYVMSSRKFASFWSVLRQCIEWDATLLSRNWELLMEITTNLQKHAYILLLLKFWWSDIDVPNITLIRDVKVKTWIISKRNNFI